MPAFDDLNERQKLFVLEYLKDFSATRAYKAAGYSEDSAHSAGPRLLEHVGVQAAIQEEMKKRQERVQIDSDMVLKELARLAFSDTTRAVRIVNGAAIVSDTEALDDGTRSAISGIKINRFTDEDGNQKETIDIKFHGKERPLEMLARHLGMFEKDNKRDVTVVGLEALITESTKKDEGSGKKD